MSKKDININSNIFNNQNKLGSGVEGNVYKVDNNIYKLFHSTKDSKLTEELCVYLTSIKTKQIRMPESILYNNQNEFCGYTTFYLNKGNGLHFGKMTTKEFFDNLNVLYKDINLLSQKHIKLEDINLFITTDCKIYVIDVGDYKYLPEESVLKVQKTNEILLNDSLIDLFQNCFTNTVIEKKAKNYFKELPLEKENFVNEIHMMLDYYVNVNSFLNDLYEELTGEHKFSK